MRFEQFDRTIGIHLGGDDRAEIIFEIKRVNGCLCTVGVVAYLQFSCELLIFVPVPMKADADAIGTIDYWIDQWNSGNKDAAADLAYAYSQLTDAQKEQMKQLREKQHEAMKPIMEKMKAKHQEEKAIFDQQIFPDNALRVQYEARDLPAGAIITQPYFSDFAVSVTLK